LKRREQHRQPEFPDVAALGVPPRRDRDVVAARADIDPGGVAMHVA
jgi:hypothetical protein